ncbi:MAG: 30S ribosomal protein S7 [Candidatus Aenigmatarchaeota archaeon]|nr:30S ribosomal protein S7 [Candidatus Aenigmarchaeota archaeon]
MIKIFNKWDTNFEVNDPGLKPYISLKPKIIPRNSGKHAGKPFYKSQINIVERLINHLYVPGHRGKKHFLTSDQCTGKSLTNYKIVKEAFEIIEKKLGKNPVEVFVRAIENTALREEITSFQVGGIIVRKAVVSSPQRRVDLALRLIVQGAYQKAFNNPKSMAQALADEIIATYNYDTSGSLAIREKERIEREAASAR